MVVFDQHGSFGQLVLVEGVLHRSHRRHRHEPLEQPLPLGRRPGSEDRIEEVEQFPAVREPRLERGESRVGDQVGPPDRPARATKNFCLAQAIAV